MDVLPVVVLLATVKKLVDFVQYIRNRDYGPVITQVVAWIGGILVMALAAHTVWADGIVWGDIALARMGFASQALAGIALGSTASLTHDAVNGSILNPGPGRSGNAR